MKEEGKAGEWGKHFCSKLIGNRSSFMQPPLASFLECVVLTLASQPSVLYLSPTWVWMGCSSSGCQWPSPAHQRDAPLPGTSIALRSSPPIVPEWKPDQARGKVLSRGRAETLWCVQYSSLSMKGIFKLVLTTLFQEVIQNVNMLVWSTKSSQICHCQPNDSSVLCVNTSCVTLMLGQLLTAPHSS